MIKDFNVLLIEDNLIEMMKIKKLLSLILLLVILKKSLFLGFQMSYLHLVNLLIFKCFFQFPAYTII